LAGGKRESPLIHQKSRVAGWGDGAGRRAGDRPDDATSRRLTAKGAVLRRFSTEILQACFHAANEVFAENSAKNADFKTIYEAFKAFRDEEYGWFGLADGSFDNFMYAQQRAGAL
jgi:TRAP-type mannitol/chloroaromatic compound transport system substrate-binding protein